MILAGARSESVKLGQSTASLIDVVFLLLIYFILTAALIRREGDIGFLIPVHDLGRNPDVPIEALIEVSKTGTVTLEGIRFGASDRQLSELTQHITGLQHLARTQEADFIVNIKPDPDALHFRIIDVMDACADADVEHLGFTKSN